VNHEPAEDTPSHAELMESLREQQKRAIAILVVVLLGFVLFFLFLREPLHFIIRDLVRL
jgi:Sec-independent protein secretion pathway component TatC